MDPAVEWKREDEAHIVGQKVTAETACNSLSTLCKPLAQKLVNPEGLQVQIDDPLQYGGLPLWVGLGASYAQ